MGGVLSSPKTEKTSESGGCEERSIYFGASSMQGWRISMEDAHIANIQLTDKASLFGVYDGHGGREVALYIGKYYPEILLNNEAFKSGDYSSALKQSYLEIDSQLKNPKTKLELHLLTEPKNPSGEDFINRLSEFIQPKKSVEIVEEKTEQQAENDEKQKEEEKKQKEQEEAKKKSEQEKEDEERKKKEIETLNPDTLEYGIRSGSTAVTALIVEKKLFVANSGDSRAVLSKAGKAINLSEDHKPTDATECQRIYNAGCVVQYNRVNGELSLSRAIGDHQYKQNPKLPPEEQAVTAFPDVTERTLEEDDEFIIIACDGIWDVKTSQEAVDFVRQRIEQKQPLDKICEQLMDVCLATTGRGLGTDNMTVVLISFGKI